MIRHTGSTVCKALKLSLSNQEEKMRVAMKKVTIMNTMRSTKNSADDYEDESADSGEYEGNQNDVDLSSSQISNLYGDRSE